MYNVRRRASGTDRAKDFSKIPGTDIPRSSFRCRHQHTTTMDAGYLYPLYVDEAYPGDTFRCSPNAFTRMLTLLYPIFSNIHVDFQFFAIPIRLVWQNWIRMHGERDNPEDSIDYTTPLMAAPALVGHPEESLADYFGIPTKVPELEHSSIPFRCYNLVYNEWYRDQDIIDSVTVDKDDGPDDPADYVLLKRAKRADYFTTGRPFIQKGDPVTLPLGTTAPVVPATDYLPRFRTLGGTATNVVLLQPGGGSTFVWDSPYEAGAGPFSLAWDDPKLEVDLTTAAAATINSIRQAFQIQRILERDARGGTRYTEHIWSHFGVTSPDFRLQRPEFLGGFTYLIEQQAVPKMSTAGAGYLGDLASWGSGGITNHSGWTKSFSEHCIVLGIASIRADLHYQQGLHRMWSRETRFDYYYPGLQRVGEQAILNKEIYAQGPAGGTDDDEPFAYQERFSELKYGQTLITGELRSNHSLPLDAWHLAQDFAGLPTLSAAFIQEDPPMNRVLAVGLGATQFMTDLVLDIVKARPMQTYSVPGLVDHF